MVSGLMAWFLACRRNGDREQIVDELMEEKGSGGGRGQDSETRKVRSKGRNESCNSMPPTGRSKAGLRQAWEQRERSLRFVLLQYERDLTANHMPPNGEAVWTATRAHTRIGGI